MKKYVANDIGVDAGLIMIADLSYLDQFEDRGDPAELGQVFRIKKGTYKVTWCIPETWNGEIEGGELLEVTSGRVFVCDPCYVIGNNTDKEWQDWLDKTDYGEKIEDGRAFVVDEMGGDGCYEVELELMEM